MDFISPMEYAKLVQTLNAKNAHQEMVFAISASQLTRLTLNPGNASKITAQLVNTLIQLHIPAKIVLRNVPFAPQQLA